MKNQNCFKHIEKKKVKKILTPLVCCLLVFCLLAGCAKQNIEKGSASTETTMAEIDNTAVSDNNISTAAESKIIETDVSESENASQTIPDATKDDEKSDFIVIDKNSQSDLMAGIKANAVSGEIDENSFSVKMTGFGVELLKQCIEGDKNILVSPLSVITALAMTENGAENDTLSQMEKTFGMTREEMNVFLFKYINSLPQGEKFKLSIANSIWFRQTDDFKVYKSFLQKNADYYNAEIYASPFDVQTVNLINDWVKRKTDEMIPEIIKELPSETVMMLINALSFEAEWQSIYYDHEVADRSFTLENGTKKTVQMMSSTEYTYLEDEKATGFLKYYNGNQYAFAAILPKDGVSVADYVSSLDGAKLSEMLLSKQEQGINVIASLPKFEYEYGKSLKDILGSMGIKDAFDPAKADFSGIGEFAPGNIYLGDVVHKTYISVAEKGTKAAAVTWVPVCGSAFVPEYRTVTLDRPFVYMIIDCQTNIPVFIGAVMDIGE